MKKIYLFAAIAALFAVACTTDDSRDVEGLPIVEDQIFVSFEDQSDTRIQLNEAQKTVWTKDDMVSVFYRSNGNQKWQYQGETGEREGVLKRVAYTEGSQELSDIVVVYPYNENYYINPKTGNVQAYLPAVQTYIKDSYGIDGNIMVSQSEYNQVSLKSVCGWLKIQLTGNGEKVQSIKINGNNGEQVAGEIYINSADATSVLASEMGKADDNENGVGGNLVFEDTILTEVTLNCSQGVTLSSEVTAFYIALPPQKFEKGLTMEILTNSGYLTKSTDNEIVINRNAIRPMEKCEFIVSKPKHNEIWYTNGSTTEATTTAYMTQPNAFGEASIQSNTYDTTKGCWVITFDKDLTTIGYSAFKECSNLTSVTIPDSVTKIGVWAFSSCRSLTSVTIPDSVTIIGPDAFYYCKSLTSVTIGNSVTTIGDAAFRECSSLTSVTIPDSVTKIGQSAFFDCSSLTSVTIGKGVTTIGQSAFYGCSNLTSVIIPDSVTTIGNTAFDKCNNLTDVTIGKSVTTIGSSAFKRCYNLQNVYILAETPPTLGSSVFPTHKFSISVPDVALEKYLESDWREYILQPFVDVEMVNISASDAIVGWSVTNWKDYATDFANAWTIVLKKGNDLVVSWNIPANSDIWSNYAYKGCRFILTGLDADTEYTVSVKDVSTGHTSDTLTFKTEASKVVTMPETTANPGDVILYEDFSDLFITADYSRGAAGYSYDNRNLMDSKEWIAKGDDPVANDVDGRGCYLVDPSVEVGMFNTIKKYIATTRLNTWGMMSEDDTNGAVCARAGYVKIGASAKCAWLVTPEINCVQQYAKVKLSFDAAVHDAYPEDTSNGLDPNTIIVELLNGCTQLSNAENSFVRPSNRIPVSTLNLTDTWTRYTIDIDNIKNGDRIAIGGNRNGVPGQHRFYLDNIEIKVVSYGDLKLSAPKNIEIIPSYTNAKVTWDKVNIAEQYVVEYANSSSPSLWTTLPATTETEATIEGLAFDTEYSVRIKAIVGNVESMFCEPVPFKTLAEIKKIATPEVKAVPGFGWFWIDVTHVPMATGYEVYKDGVKVDATLVSTSETNTVYRVDANLPLDTDFSYEV
ncbi:MAG: fibronectin type III domain-containing protein, partial [Alistipes sp.]|nr:fibronectin type III domain-containing protein [Alistipes sp.]